MILPHLQARATERYLEAFHEEAERTLEIARLPAPNTLASLRAHTALARVIKESMRLYPESWAVGREALEQLEVGGWAVEPRT